jgi:hypothetical protein
MTDLIPDESQVHAVAVVQYLLTLLQPATTKLSLTTSRHLFHFCLTELHVITEICKEENKRLNKQGNSHKKH